MRIAILLLVFTLYNSVINAQNTATSEHIAPASAEMFIDEYANKPTESRIVTNEFYNVDGSPFVTDEWVKATVTIDSVHIYQNVQIRLNVYDNKIHFKDFEGNERMLNTKVKEVKITDPASPFNNAVIAEYGRFEMMIGNRLFFKTFYMYKVAFVVIIRIALAAHTCGSLFIQVFKITINSFLCRYLLAGRHSKRHDIPYHRCWF